MKRRWVSTLFWILFFGLGLYLSRRTFDATQNKTYQMADLFNLKKAESVTEQTVYTPEARRKRKKEVQRAEKATPSPAVISVQDLVWYLRDDRLCDFVKSAHDRSTLIQAVVEVSQSPLLKNLFGVNGPMNGRPSYNDSDRVITYFNALLYAGLIVGLNAPAVDYPYSEKLFRDLETHDPDNGAYFYFHAYEAQKAKRSLKEQHNLLMSAFRAQNFNTYLGQILELLKANLKTNPTLWMASIEAISQMPIPDYPPPAFVVDLIKDDDSEIHQQAVMFGMRMFDQPSMIITVQKRFGMAIVEKTWERAYPTQAKPSLELKMKATDPEAEARMSNEWTRAAEAMNATPCDRHWVDDYFSKYRDETYENYE
ncbi:MAG: hypothetical protein JST80_00600 [Bdellovibrionales bacterium]|nr:hypothetical protein [Bdellovibrionales bacterium]